MKIFPEEIGTYVVARATLTGEIVIDTMTIEDLITAEREAFENRDQLQERMVTGEVIHKECILGIYKTMEEATASLDWVRAWRSGS